jgi:hypothetical protein
MASRYVLLFLVFYAGFYSVAADQSGAELQKKPVKAEIVTKGEAQEFGNVRVTYEDGTSDFWTKKGHCSLARVAPDGTVGWIVDNNLGIPDLPRAFDSTLILSRKGRIISRISSACPVIEDWNFIPSGKQLVLRAGHYHGPRGIFELHDMATGDCLQSVSADDKNLPVWVKVLKE